MPSITGSTIHFPHDVNEIAKRLPRRADDLPVYVICKKEDPRYVFRVRPWALKLWLLFLKKYNKFYEDIELDEELL